MTTRLHAVVDGLGNPLRIKLAGGNFHDMVPACGFIADLEADQVLADKAYDADKLIAQAQDTDAEPVYHPEATGR